MQRIGNFLDFESFALIDNPNCKLIVTRLGDYLNLFIPVVAVSVHNRVDHAFSHCHTDPVLFVFIETSLLRGTENFGFGVIYALER